MEQKSGTVELVAGKRRYERHTVWLVLFVLLALPAPVFPDTLTGHVRVVDGDSLYFENLDERVRLQGIDAPESRQECKSAKGARYGCGLVATRALRQKIAARPVRCEGGQRDRYGRLLGTCFTSDGTDLNGWLVERGHALVYRRYPQQYVAQETAAREADRGIWSGSFVKPWEWRRGQRLP